jgi:SAM-dependent methyltransferase
MLDAGRVTANDYVIDLGSGDGRLVIAASRRGARATGVELDANLVATATREAARSGEGGKVNFINANLFTFDFSKATVLTMYLLPHINLDLRPRILSGLRPGTRVVSHDFDMGKWRPDLRREIAVPDKVYGPPVSQVYMWYVPANVAGKWQWRLPVGDVAVRHEVTFRQTFQQLTGDAAIEGGSATIEGAKLQGDAIAFTLVHANAGRKVAYEFSGRVDGDKIAGSVKTGGDDKTYDWQATRFARGQMSIE